MRENQKYTTYFPVFIELSALTQWAGLRDFEPWVDVWRFVFLAVNLAIAGALFALIYPRGRLLAALFAALFWLFNRWTLHVTRIAHLEFIPLFLVLLSVGLFRKHRWASLLLFSLSLGVKQIGIFLAPVYLIWTWQASGSDRARQTWLAALAIASVPLVSSLPFLAWSTPGHPLSGVEGMVKSIVFSATRDPADHFKALSLDGLMGWLGLAGRLPMLGMLLLAYALAWQRKVGPYLACLIVMATFLEFNSVLFRQYMIWIIPLIPLAACDLWDARRSNTSPAATTG
jgi:hypothetical protein